MCGIAGYWNYRTQRPASLETIRTMTRTLRHRGPDEEGYHVAGAMALGMRRLQVIDPAGGHQPMTAEDDTIQVIFNGEIYNHAELRGELEACGHRFRTRSDTEVIAHAYEEWGTRCVERFNGMFAFAVADARRGSLFIARDRLGIKPLYYSIGPEGLVFGSELKAVVAAPWVDVEWDRAAIDDFMTYEYIPAPRTLVRGVRKLPPGTGMLFTGGDDAPGPVPFWTLAAQSAPATAAIAQEQLRDRLATAVRRRLIADVPLGAFLSGGIDSSIVVALMSRQKSDPVRTFSMGFEDRSYNELEYARAVAQMYGTIHTEELVSPHIVEMAEQIADFYDEPFADVSAFPTYLISTLARRDVTVALSGDGGDELFAGYDSYRAHRIAARLSLVSRTWGWRALDEILKRVPPRPAKKGLINKAKRFAAGARHPADLEHARWLVFWDIDERRALYTPDALEAVSQRDIFGYYRELLSEGSRQGYSGLQRQLYADVRGYLVDDILTKVDRASMAVSLEVRVPFLDHEVVELAMSIPDDWKLTGSRSKAILRDAFAPLLPATVTRRGKEGFSMPMKNWLRGPLQPLMHDLLSPSRLRERGLFEVEPVHALMKEHVAGRENHAHRLWCLMALELSFRSLERTLLRTRAVTESQVSV